MSQSYNEVVLTLAVGGYFFSGSLEQWKAYLQPLIKGKVAAFKRSGRRDNMSVTQMVRYFRSLWNEKQGPMPDPETFGLLKLQPDYLTNADLVDEVLGRYSAPGISDAELEAFDEAA